MIWPVRQSFSNLVLPRCLPKRTRRKIRTARLARVSVKLDKKVSKLFWLVGPWIEHICRPRMWLHTFKHGVLWCTYVAAFGWSGAVPFMLTCTPEGESTHSEKNVTNWNNYIHEFHLEDPGKITAISWIKSLRPYGAVRSFFFHRTTASAVSTPPGSLRMFLKICSLP